MDDTNLTPWGAVMSAAKDDADEPDTPAATAEEIAGPSPVLEQQITPCLLYTSPSPRDKCRSRMPSSA